MDYARRITQAVVRANAIITFKISCSSTAFSGGRGVFVNKVILFFLRFDGSRKICVLVDPIIQILCVYIIVSCCFR